MMIMTTVARLERFFPFFPLFPSQYADQGDWESARVSSVDGMTIRLMRNDVVQEKKNNESYF